MMKRDENKPKHNEGDKKCLTKGYNSCCKNIMVILMVRERLSNTC